MMKASEPNNPVTILSVNLNKFSAVAFTFHSKSLNSFDFSSALKHTESVNSIMGDLQLKGINCTQFIAHILDS